MLMEIKTESKTKTEISSYFSFAHVFFITLLCSINYHSLLKYKYDTKEVHSDLRIQTN